jgi:hypothetical protein
VKAFAVPRAGWAEAFEQFGIPKGHTGPAEEMFEAVNAGWMDLGVEGTEHVAGTTSARDVFEAAQNRQGVRPGRIRHETETARFCVGRVAGSARQFKATRSASTPAGNPDATAAIRNVRFTLIRDVAQNVSNAQLPDIRRRLGERTSSTGQCKNFRAFSHEPVSLRGLRGFRVEKIAKNLALLDRLQNVAEFLHGLDPKHAFKMGPYERAKTARKRL